MHMNHSQIYFYFNKGHNILRTFPNKTFIPAKFSLSAFGHLSYFFTMEFIPFQTYDDRLTTYCCDNPIIYF